MPICDPVLWSKGDGPVIVEAESGSGHQSFNEDLNELLAHSRDLITFVNFSTILFLPNGVHDRIALPLLIPVM